MAVCPLSPGSWPLSLYPDSGLPWSSPFTFGFSALSLPIWMQLDPLLSLTTVTAFLVVSVATSGIN